MQKIRWWWGQPDHYVWFGTYLQLRRMSGMARAVLAGTAGSLALIHLALIFGSAPPEGGVRIALAISSIAGGFGCALLWVLCWPTKRGSTAFAATASASTAMATLAQSDPTIALLTCTAFATVSGYIAVFHTAPFMVVNAIVVLAIPVVPVAALIATQGVVRALCEYALVAVVNIAVPFGMQILVHALGLDLVNADRDDLTGLLNRRAFYEQTNRLVAAQGFSESHLVVTMIDLDRFKLLDDTMGHAAGDRVLIAVGQRLREHARPSAIVGRVGGEEFLIADVFGDPRQAALGRRLCDAVAGLPYGVTASIGIAGARCDEIAVSQDSNLSITTWIAVADGAMYDAKRTGGNQSRQRVGPLDEYIH